MVRLTSLFVLLFVCGSFHAQEEYIQPGLLKATATIAPSYMLNRNVKNIYLSGFAEYHLDKKLSFRGDVFYFVDGQGDLESHLWLKDGFRTYFGAFYHFNKSNWDKYIGIQPGISLLRPLGSVESDARLQAIPSFSVHAGTTFYVWKYFNFYLDLAYVNSTYRGLKEGSAQTDELIVSAGLGFQIQTKRKSN